MSRFLAFILGMLFGVIVIFGALAGGLFFTYTAVPPSDLWPEADKFLGDLAHMPIQSIVEEMISKYNNKILEDGTYYTLGHFLNDYNINPVEAFGVEFPTEVTEIPLFEFFDAKIDENGDTGTMRALKKVKVSAIPAIINLFGGTDEDGNPKTLIAEQAFEELSKHSMVELFDTNGFATVFENIPLNWLLPDSFPAEGAETDNVVLQAVGQAKLGKLLLSLDGGESNVLSQLKEGGALEAVGALQLMQVAGTSDGGSQLLDSLLGDAKIRDLIDESGNINPDSLVADLQLGTMLQMVRRPVDEALYTDIVIVDNNGTEDDDSDDFAVVKSYTDGENVYYARVAGEKWYESYDNCTVESTPEEPHDCLLECYPYNWYSLCEEPEDGAHNHEHVEFSVENDADGNPIVNNYVAAEGLQKALTALSMDDLMAGNFDKVISNLTLRDAMGDDIPEMLKDLADVPIGELSAEIDNMYLGSLLGFEKLAVEVTADTSDLVANENGLFVYIDGENVAISEDKESWFVAQTPCVEDHEHVADCYTYAWYKQCTCEDETHEHIESEHFTNADGITAYALADGLENVIATKKIDQLSDLNSIIENEVTLGVALGDNLPDMLKDYADTPVGDMGKVIDEVYVGLLLGNEKLPVDIGDADTSGYVENEDGLYVYVDGDTIAISENNKRWFEGYLTCKLDDAGHEHDSNCYGYTWYKQCTCTDPTHEHIESEHFSNADGITTYALVDGFEKAISGKRVQNLGDLNSTIQDEITLGEVMGANIPNMLKDYSDTTIGELGTVIDSMYLGQAMDYVRHEVTLTGSETTLFEGEGIVVVTDGTNNYRLDDGKYYAAYTCEKDHEHKASCYRFLWYKQCTTLGCEHNEKHIVVDEKPYVLVEDMTAKLATDRINGLSNISSTIDTLTLGEVITGAEDNHILSNLKDTPIGELPSRFDTLTLGEVMEFDESSNKILVELKDTPISEMSSAINDVYIGTAMGYDKHELEGFAPTGTLIDHYDNDTPDNAADDIFVYTNGEDYVMSLDNKLTWHKAEKTCKVNKNSHTHDSYCYSMWFDENDQAVTGISAKLANEKISGLSNLTHKVQNFTIGDVISEEVTSGNNILNSLRNTKLKDISAEMNELYLGTVFGYKQKDLHHLTQEQIETLFPEQVLGSDVVRAKAVGFDSSIEYIRFNGEDWCEAKFMCMEVHEGVGHSLECVEYKWFDPEADDFSKEIMGLNEKMANLTVEQVSNGESLTNLEETLTVGDLIDAGLLDIDNDEEEAKLNLIIHNCGATITDPNNSAQQIECTYAGYDAYKRLHPTIGSRQYWDWFNDYHAYPSCHENAWRELRVTEFIKILLGVI